MGLGHTTVDFTDSRVAFSVANAVAWCRVGVAIARIRVALAVTFGWLQALLKIVTDTQPNFVYKNIGRK